MAHSKAEYRFRPLVRYLAALPAEQRQVRLTPADLEVILGPSTSDLPTSMPNWNTVDVARAFRQRAGFDAKVDRTDHSITFTRQPLGSRQRQEA